MLRNARVSGRRSTQRNNMAATWTRTVLVMFFVALFPVSAWLNQGATGSKSKETRFYIHESRARRGEYTAKTLTTLSRRVFRQRKTIFILVPDRNQSPDSLRIIRNTLQKRQDYFVSIDWSDWKDSLLYCGHVDVVGKDLAKLIKFIEATRRIKRQSIHLIGILYGGNVAAAAATHLGYKKIGRVTVFNPCPCCVMIKQKGCENLSPNAAMFVDTISLMPFSFPVFTWGHAEFFAIPFDTKDMKMPKVSKRSINIKKPDMQSFTRQVTLTTQVLNFFSKSMNKRYCQIKGRACKGPGMTNCDGQEGTMGYYATKPKKRTIYLVKSLPKSCV